MKKDASKNPSKAALEKQYFEEARSWDSELSNEIQSSKKKAWLVAIAATTIAVLEAIAIASLAPLKTVEPFIVRVDNNTGVVDVISTLTKTDGQIEAGSQESLDNYFLGQYIRHREAYQWETRDYNRKIVGLFSNATVQQQYAAYTDPRQYDSAPVVIYGDSAVVDVRLKSISTINAEKIDGKEHVTALVRYTKQVKRKGERSPLTHWAATVTYYYLNSPMKIDDRQLNPLGFQVINYRNDQESIGG